MADDEVLDIVFKSYRIFHHGEEEKGAYVAETVDVFMDCREGLPQILSSLEH